MKTSYWNHLETTGTIGSESVNTCINLQFYYTVCDSVMSLFSVFGDTGHSLIIKQGDFRIWLSVFPHDQCTGVVDCTAYLKWLYHLFQLVKSFFALMYDL